MSHSADLCEKGFLEVQDLRSSPDMLVYIVRLAQQMGCPCTLLRDLAPLYSGEKESRPFEWLRIDLENFRNGALYRAGDRVQRRNRGLEWQWGYVTSTSPLRVSVEDDPRDSRGYSWDEVRKQERDTRYAAEARSAEEKRRFFNVCLEEEFRCEDKTHIRHLLISDLYSKVKEERVIEAQWSAWIREQFRAALVEAQVFEGLESKVTCAADFPSTGSAVASSRHYSSLSSRAHVLQPDVEFGMDLGTMSYDQSRKLVKSYASRTPQVLKTTSSVPVMGVATDQAATASHKILPSRDVIVPPISVPTPAKASARTGRPPAPCQLATTRSVPAVVTPTSATTMSRHTTRESSRGTSSSNGCIMTGALNASPSGVAKLFSVGGLSSRSSQPAILDGPASASISKAGFDAIQRCGNIHEMEKFILRLAFAADAAGVLSAQLGSSDKIVEFARSQAPLYCDVVASPLSRLLRLLTWNDTLTALPVMGGPRVDAPKLAPREAHPGLCDATAFRKLL